jgi:hypothetical protein
VLDRLAPYAPYVANLGHVGVVGPVSLAMARLSAMLGETDAARSLLAHATDLAERAGGVGSLVRCRLLAAELDDADPGVFTALAAEADTLGLHRVAAQARARRLVPA